LRGKNSSCHPISLESTLLYQLKYIQKEGRGKGSSKVKGSYTYTLNKWKYLEEQGNEKKEVMTWMKKGGTEEKYLCNYMSESNCTLRSYWPQQFVAHKSFPFLIWHSNTTLFLYKTSSHKHTNIVPPSLYLSLFLFFHNK
jgi:hypothetical protein